MKKKKYKPIAMTIKPKKKGKFNLENALDDFDLDRAKRTGGII